MRKLLCVTFIALMSFGSLIPASLAIELDPEEISAELPANWHRPLATYLLSAGWKNAELLVTTAKRGHGFNQSIVIRVIDNTTCDSDKDLCLTIIGHLKKETLIVEAIFYAGGKANVADHGTHIGGTDGPTLLPIRFFGKRLGVLASPTKAGWIIIPTLIESRNDKKD